MNESDLRPGPKGAPQADFPPEEEIELLDYVEVVVRKRWLIFWGMVLCGLAAVVYAFGQPVVYQAEVIILPPERQDYLQLSNIEGQMASRSVYLDVLQGATIRREVVQKVYQYELEGRQSQTDLQEYFQAKSMQQAIKALEEAVDFEVEGRLRGTGVITIAVEMKSAQLAAAVANEYTAQLDLYNRRTWEKRLAEQLSFMEKRLDEVQDNLNEAEQALVYFRDHNRNLIGTGEESTFLTSEQAIEYSRLSLEVEIHSSLLFIILNQYEIAQIESKKKLPAIEVFSAAEPPEASSRTGRKKAGLVGGMVGLLMSVFLAFLMEYLEHNRKSGRMEPILEELRKDRDRVRRLLGRGR